MQILQKDTQVDDKTIAADKEVLQHAYPATPVADEHAYDVVVAFDIKAGLITSAPPYQQLVDNQTAVQALQGFRPSV
ncbi:hypothetical protein [Thermogemmatispora tikiterensis]|nr:hypothetical protein [Thermogemmatispora tikiterensis]